MKQIKKAWHHGNIIWCRFPGIVHGLTVEEAKQYIHELQEAIVNCKNSSDDDKFY